MPQESMSPNFNELFSSALALQQEKKWDESLAAYEKLLDQSRNDLGAQQGAVIYYNMSAIAFAKADFLKAYVWSKKALHINPSNQQIRETYENYAKKIEIPSIPHQISGLDQVKKIITVIPNDVWLIMSLALVLATLWMFLKRILKIRKNALDGVFKKPKIWVESAAVLLTIIVILGCLLSLDESRKQYAVVISEKAGIQTVPGENKPVIFEAFAGLELEILAANDNYYQVRYPGAFTGWVNRSQIELLSLSFRQ